MTSEPHKEADVHVSSRLHIRSITQVLVGLLVALATLVGVGGVPVGACSCLSPASDAAAMAESDFVFVGTVEEYLPHPPLEPDAPGEAWSDRYRVRVDEVYKGAVHELQTVVAPSRNSMCGANLGDGRVFVVAWGAGEGMIPGEVRTHLCAGSRPLLAAEDPVGLEEARRPIPGASALMIVGTPVITPADDRAGVHLVLSAGVAVLGAALVAAWLLGRRRRADEFADSRERRPPPGGSASPQAV